MPKVAKELTALQVKHLKRTGLHAVGGIPGLLLQVRNPTGTNVPTSRSWILRTRLGAERIHMGLGSYPTVSLAEAREMARKKLLECREGINPIQKRKAERSATLANQSRAKTFKECAAAYLGTHLKAFTNEKHRKQWESTLETYVYPVIGNRLVANISMGDVLSVLEQSVTDPSDPKKNGKFWEIKTETATRVQGRIKAILDYAIVKEYRIGSNPAIWDGVLSTQLASPSKITKVKHFPAVAYKEAPKVFGLLRKNKSVSSLAIQFLALTAVRPGSVRMATWPQVNLLKKVWTIPPENTKTKEEHRVPLSPEAVRVLRTAPRLANTNLIFPGKRNKPLSDMALSQLMRGMHERGEIKQRAVPHGWRSTFRDWAADMTSYPDDIRKAASGHKIGDAVQAAYQRTDLLEKRRQLMNEWAAYLAPKSKKKGRKN